MALCTAGVLLVGCVDPSALPGWRTETIGGPVAIVRAVEADNTVGSVTAGSAAEAIGLRAGDRVVRVGGRDTPDWPAVVEAVTLWGAIHHEGDVLEVTWERAGTRHTASAAPRWATLNGGQRVPVLGIRARVEGE